MRSTINKIIFMLGVFPIATICVSAFSKDFSKTEAICKDIGFTPKTEAFGECVLELVERVNVMDLPSSFDADSQTCLNYGFKLNTQAFAECKFKLDIARQESSRAQEQYAREKEVYDKRIAEIEKERERARGMKQLELGLRMLGGQTPLDAINSVGTGKPITPIAPSPIHQTITTPSGRMINCTTIGNNTNCF